ncbi:MAG: hypothetical protein WCB58_22110 [Acidobacteriaceae bacterium]
MMQRREFLGHMVRTALAVSTVMAAGRSAWPLADAPTGSARRASVVESNRFNNRDTLRPAGAAPWAIVLPSLDQSTVTTNEAAAPAKIVMIDCTDKVKVGDNGPLTNATS